MTQHQFSQARKEKKQYFLDPVQSNKGIPVTLKSRADIRSIFPYRMTNLSHLSKYNMFDLKRFYSNNSAL